MAGAGHKPNSVTARGSGGHLSDRLIAQPVERPTHPLGRAVLKRGWFGLAPDGVCPASAVTSGAV